MEITQMSADRGTDKGTGTYRDNGYYLSFEKETLPLEKTWNLGNDAKWNKETRNRKTNIA